MKTLLLTTLSTLALALPALAQNGGVAILDIDEVARQLGVEEKVRVDLINIQNNLNADLQRTQETMQKQMNGVEQAAGENPTDEQRREIIATNQQLNEEFNRLKAQAQNTVAQEHARMIADFRTRLEPIALKAAQEIGLDVVMMKATPPLLTYAQGVDITQSTTKLALEAGLQVKAADLESITVPVIPDAATDGKAKGEAQSETEGKSKGE